MALVILWIASIDASGTTVQWPPPPIRNSEIQSGALVFFLRDRVQKSPDLDKRAEQLDIQLARIMDPPFDTEHRRVNIEKVYDPAVKVGVKPKHLILAKSMFDDESVLAPSPNQKLKLQIYKLPNHQKPFQSMWKQLILTDQLKHCDGAFLMYSEKTYDGLKTLLQFTAKRKIFLFKDMQPLSLLSQETEEEQQWEQDPTTREPDFYYLLRFLKKITSPSYIDGNTLDDFRELVANHVFSDYLLHDVEVFEAMIARVAHLLGQHDSKSFKILRIFHRNLHRNQPTVCPKLEVMRDDFVTTTMVHDMLFFIWQRGMHHDYVSTMRHLPNLYKLMGSMGSNVEATKEMWDWRDKQNEEAMLAFIANCICRKIGLITGLAEFTNEQVLKEVKEITSDMNRGWHTHLTAEVFHVYWQHLYKLKRSGFSGRIAIVNRYYILEDSWIQSLFGIFGRDNTVIESVAEL